MQSQYNKLLNCFTLVLAICTFFLIVAGGLVTSTDSGLSVPDWPLSYGKLMPPMVGGIFYEHGHRMIASFVGFLTVLLVFLMFRKETRIWLHRLALVALAAVILQGVLGGLTVLYLLPAPISVSHATLAQTFFCIVASIALFQSRWWQTPDLPIIEGEKSRSLFLLGIIAASAVYVQLILGALMRHTASGLAVPDFPFAYGQIIPSLSPEALQQYNSVLIAKDIRLAADGPVTSSQIIIHLLHRFWAVVAATAVLTFGYRLYIQSRTTRKLFVPAVTLLLLIPVQIGFGAFTVLTRKSVGITTAHVATGALILMTSVVTTLMIYRIKPRPKRDEVRALDLKEAVA